MTGSVMKRPTALSHSRPDRIPWYPWVLTAVAAGSSIALNLGHPYIPLDPPPRLMVACVYRVPPVCAPFAWHQFLLRLAHRRHQHNGQDRTRAASTLCPATRTLGSQPTGWISRHRHRHRHVGVQAVSDAQDGESSRALVRVLVAAETQDRPVSWQGISHQTGGSRSRAYASCQRNAPGWPLVTATSPRCRCSLASPAPAVNL
jgi:hypothetical protein